MSRTKAIIDGWMIADGRGLTDGHQMRYVTPCVTQGILHNSSLYIYSLPTGCMPIGLCMSLRYDSQ